MASPPTESAQEPAVIAEPVASWIEPLADLACGPDLEYEPGFLELNRVAAGKPETTLGNAAEPPEWGAVRELAEALLPQTRDLRVALLWGRALLNTEGLPGLLPALQLFNGLLTNFWSQGLHPALDPDDEDSFARLSVMGSLDKLDGFLGDVRQALVLPDRRLGGLRVREVEIALDRLSPRADESVRSIGQLQGQLGDLPELALQVRRNATDCLREIKKLQLALNECFGLGSAVELKSMRLMLDAVLVAVPEPAAPEAGDADDALREDTDDSDFGGTTQRRSGGASGRGGSGVTSIQNRQEAIRAINLVCDYLERSEPTNPAQLLLRRASRLIDKNFLQLVRDLAPDAIAEVARIMGVEPDSISMES